MTPHIITAKPYTARQCTVCHKWIYVDNGPFAEDGDRTKTLADAEHYEAEHATADDYTDANGGRVFGFPYMAYNIKTVQAVWEDRRGD
jgi:hypothetical protein